MKSRATRFGKQNNTRNKQTTKKKWRKKVGLGITKKGKKRFSAVPENLNEKAILIIYKAGQFILAKRTTQ